MDPFEYSGLFFRHFFLLSQIFFFVLCVCVFSSHSFWRSSSMDVPAEVTQDFSSTFLLRCVP